MSIKQNKRLRRAAATKRKIKKQHALRLCVHRSLKHMYVQLISADGKNVITSASTLDKALQKSLKKTTGKDAAAKVGTLIANRIKKLAIEGAIAFDRNGLKYHGRVKALADAAREAGLPI